MEMVETIPPEVEAEKWIGESKVLENIDNNRVVRRIVVPIVSTFHC